MSAYIEDTYETAVVELLEGIGWKNVDANDIERDLDEPLDLTEVEARVAMLNKGVLPIAIREAIQKVRNIEMANLVKRNAVFTNYLQSGVEVTYTMAGQKKAALVKLVDFEDRTKNSFRVVRQWKMRGFANNNAANLCRAAYRQRHAPDYKMRNLGFRICFTADVADDDLTRRSGEEARDERAGDGR